MNVQMNIEYGKKLRDLGIQRAENHANDEVANWSDDCLNLFRVWLDNLQSGSFQMEDFRAYATTILDAPPSLRAFGAIALKAQKNGWITRVGMAPVDNPSAHRAIANTWKKMI